MIEKKSAGAVIFKRENEIKYLLIKKKGEDHWEFPKGKVEHGESDIETAKREIMEESGICTPKFIDGFEMSDSFSPKEGLKKTVKIFLAESNEEVIVSHEHEDFEWVLFKDLDKFITKPQLINVFKKINKFIENNLGK